MRLGVGFLLIAAVVASPEIRYFRYQRSVQNVPQHPAQTCFVVDADTFAHAAPQLADLRLYRDNTEIPYVIHLTDPVEAAEKTTIPLNLGQRGGQTVFDAELSEARYSDLQLAVTAQDFIATVTVSGSQAEEGRSETKLGAYTIFDFTRQKLGRSTVLHLPESNFRYLHFRITGPLPPESITGLSVVRLPASQPKYETVSESSQIKQQGHSSTVAFKVPAHVPVDRIAFDPGPQPLLFSRNVDISVVPVSSRAGQEGAEPQQPVTSSGDLLRIHSEQNGHRIDEERLTIEAPEVDFNIPAVWTITINNGDDAPLMMESVRLQMLQRRICFEAAGNGRYALFYGDPALTAPRYDYASLFIAQADASAAVEGTEQSNPGYQTRPDDRPFTEKHPALLWVTLAAVIALLGGIVLRSVKRTTQGQP
jgi:hypothetical protein